MKFAIELCNRLTRSRSRGTSSWGPVWRACTTALLGGVVHRVDLPEGTGELPPIDSLLHATVRAASSDPRPGSSSARVLHRTPSAIRLFKQGRLSAKCSRDSVSVAAVMPVSRETRCCSSPHNRRSATSAFFARASGPAPPSRFPRTSQFMMMRSIPLHVCVPGNRETGRSHLAQARYVPYFSCSAMSLSNALNTLIL